MPERWVTTDDGVALRAFEEGIGPDLVLAHGGPGLWDYLDPLGAMLEDRAHIWRYDQRGCGRSAGGEGPYTVERFVQDLATYRERVLVGGHSWGATLALLYATAYPPRIGGVLYICGTGIDWSRWKAAYHTEKERRAGRRYSELSRQREHSPEALQDLRALGWAADYADLEVGLRGARAMLASGYAVNEQCSAAMNAEIAALDPASWHERCSALTAPVLVIHGARDPRPVEALDSLIRLLPNARLVVLRGAGHYPWVETPTAFRDAIDVWLDAL